MSQIGRPIKSLEAPRPLKSLSRPALPSTSTYEVQSIEELITLTENVAGALSLGQSNADSMSILLANLRVHGPQLEAVSKDTLDRAFVTFRNASQDERLTIIARMNLLELIELRAKSWQTTDGVHTYYKHKASDNLIGHQQQQHQQQHQQQQQAPNLAAEQLGDDLGLLGVGVGTGTSPLSLSLAANAVPMLNPGELLRNSGKFTKPTKIPGKNYSKDEVVIRNADSGKVMGIKGRRVHMIEEMSETIISFQRVNAGAKERLVQITGPSEDKIVYAKQLIEDTIRRNASPVRLEAGATLGAGGGSCSSLASSASDEAATVAAVAAHVASAGSTSSVVFASPAVLHPHQHSAHLQQQQMLSHTSSTHSNRGMSEMLGGYQQQSGHNNGAGLKMQLQRQHSHHAHHQPQHQHQHQLLQHSQSTNDASLGEYKYTVAVGAHSVKITGDCFELVRIAKLVLDDYFSSADFLASVEAGAAYAEPGSAPTTPAAGHQLNASGSPFVDSGIGLNYRMAAAAGGGGSISAGQSVEVDDDVFVGDPQITADSSALVTSTPHNGLTRSRRSHFSRKDSTPEMSAHKLPSTAEDQHQHIGAAASGSAPIAASAAASAAGGDSAATAPRIVHEYERLLYYAKSPHSWAQPKDWERICSQFPLIVRTANAGQDLERFDPDKHLQRKKSGSVGPKKQNSPAEAGAATLRSSASATSVEGGEQPGESSPSPDPQ